MRFCRDSLCFRCRRRSTPFLGFAKVVLSCSRIIEKGLNMSTATALFLQGLSWGLGVGCAALCVGICWGSFVKSVNSV